MDFSISTQPHLLPREFGVILVSDGDAVNQLQMIPHIFLLRLLLTNGTFDENGQTFFMRFSRDRGKTFGTNVVFHGQMRAVQRRWQRNAAKWTQSGFHIGVGVGGRRRRGHHGGREVGVERPEIAERGAGSGRGSDGGGDGDRSVAVDPVAALQMSSEIFLRVERVGAAFVRAVDHVGGRRLFHRRWTILFTLFLRVSKGGWGRWQILHIHLSISGLVIQSYTLIRKGMLKRGTLCPFSSTHR